MARVKDQWKDPARSGRGKRWLAVWQAPDGERTKAFIKKYDAEQYARKQESDTARGLYIDPSAARITIAEWCKTWLSGYATRRPSTVRQAKIHVAQIEREFGDLTLSAVRPSAVRDWTARLLAEGRQASYVDALHARLSQVMGDAVHDGLLAKSPCSKRTAPGKGKQRPFVATTEQVWALYDRLPEHLRAAVLLGAFVGLRVAEACGLRVTDVDFMRGIVHPRVQYPAEELKTEMSKTPVPIPRTLALELSAHVERWPGKTLLNRAGEQIPPSTIDYHVRKRRADAGLPDGFRFHDLRHYLASLLIADGADVKVVQTRLRHKSATTTLDTYMHLWPDADESTRATITAVLESRAEQRRSREGSA